MDRSRLISVVVAGVAALAAASPVLAQQKYLSNTCDRLQAEYRSALARSASRPGQHQTGQTTRLSRQLAQARLTAERNGCIGSALFVKRRDSPRCPAMLSEVRRLAWEMRRAGGGTVAVAGAAASDVARLRAALANTGCAVARREPTARDMTGGRRTLCVRLCDGYYFPIEFKARHARFKIDAAACQSMYAADGQAELFVQSAAADVASARSLASGARYGDQPYAFAFRETYTPACVAELHDGLRALAVRYYAQAVPAAKVAAAASARLPLPQIRRPRSEDPETFANAAGHFAFRRAAIALALADRPVRLVRMVGPAYYARLFDLTLPPVRQAARRPLFSLVSPAAAAESVAPQ